MTAIYEYLTSKRKRPADNKRLKSISDDFCKNVALDLFELASNALRANDAAMLSMLNLQYKKAVSMFFEGASSNDDFNLTTADEQRLADIVSADFLRFLTSAHAYSPAMRINSLDTRESEEITVNQHDVLREHFDDLNSPAIYEILVKHPSYFSPDKTSSAMHAGYLLSKFGPLKLKDNGSISEVSVVNKSLGLSTSLLLLNEFIAKPDAEVMDALFQDAPLKHLNALRLTAPDYLNSARTSTPFYEFFKECIQTPIEQFIFHDLNDHLKRIYGLNSFKELINDLTKVKLNGWPQHIDGKPTELAHGSSSGEMALTFWNSEVLLLRAYATQMERLCKAVMQKISDQTLGGIAKSFVTLTAKLWETTGGTDAQDAFTRHSATLPLICADMEFPEWGSLFAQCLQISQSLDTKFNYLPSGFIRGALNSGVFDDEDAALFMRNIKFLSMTRLSHINHGQSSIKAIAYRDSAKLIYDIHTLYPDLYEPCRERITALLKPGEHLEFDHAEAETFNEMSERRYNSIISTVAESLTPSERERLKQVSSSSAELRM